MSITLIIVFVMFAGLVPSAIGLSQYCNTIAYLQTDIQVQIKVLKVVEVNSKDENYHKYSREYYVKVEFQKINFLRWKSF